jgi:peptidoglycan/xylan/chitin deacetylase (PgdA/CDA1 family)
LLKHLTASMTGSRAFAKFVGLLERMDHEGPDLLRVLTYHRVEWGTATPSPSPAITISPDAFSEQMRFIRRRYHPVSVEQVIHAVRTRTGLPRRSVLVTFDDGYEDFRSQAWPVLKELGLPVVLFVPTAYPSNPGNGFWWDRLHHAVMHTSRRDGLETSLGRLSLSTTRGREDASARLRAHVKGMQHSDALDWVAAICRDLGVPPAPPALLTWDQLRELKKEGVAVGSHTRTHPLLTRVPPEEGRAEVAGALRDLARELGTALPILAYPAGAFDDRVVQILEEEGYVLAFTTARGVNDLARAHPLKLRRTYLGARSSLSVLRVQLMGRSVALNRFFPLTAPRETARA